MQMFYRNIKLICSVGIFETIIWYFTFVWQHHCNIINIIVKCTPFSNFSRLLLLSEFCLPLNPSTIEKVHMTFKSNFLHIVNAQINSFVVFKCICLFIHLAHRKLLTKWTKFQVTQPWSLLALNWACGSSNIWFIYTLIHSFINLLDS